MNFKKELLFILAASFAFFCSHSFAAKCNGKEATIVLEENDYKKVNIDALTGRPYVDVYGTNGDDVIVSYGFWVIDAKKGNDSICNHAKKTVVLYVIAGEGNDYVLGGNSADYIWGDAGDDEIYGLAGVDRIWGGSGNDYIVGGDHEDQIAGGTGDDILYGGAGKDVINGSSGHDEIYGGSGDDYIYGFTGDDDIFGNDGNDRIWGDQPRDTSKYRFDAEWFDFVSTSTPGLTEKPTWGSGVDYIEGGLGHDTIVGGGGPDLIYGGSGNDKLHGNGGDDFLDGGSGNNTCRQANDSSTSWCDE